MKTKIAHHLLEIDAVTLQPSEPFTWSSGIKSPIYCDNRLTLSYPNVRRDIALAFQQVIKAKFPEVEVVAGTATAGIAHAALVSELLAIPMVYVRSEVKGHGRGNQIEGKIYEGQKVVVIEDLISTGGSVLTVVKALREAGCDVIGAVSIFTYELKQAFENFSAVNIPAYSLTDFSTLVEIAKSANLISENELEQLHSWRANPYHWQD